jgi:hypothetical protein
MNEKVFVQKNGISSEENFSAIFSRNTIFVEDNGLEIEPGNIIVRIKDSHVERYTVLISEHKSMDETIPVYQLTVELLSDLPNEIDQMIS